MVRRLWNRTRLLLLFTSKKLGHACNLSVNCFKEPNVFSVSEGENKDEEKVDVDDDDDDDVLYLTDYISSIIVARKLL